MRLIIARSPRQNTVYGQPRKNPGPDGCGARRSRATKNPTLRWLFAQERFFASLRMTRKGIKLLGVDAEVAAAGAYGDHARTAQRTVGGVVAFHLDFNQGFGAHRQLQAAAAAVDQRAGSHDAPAGLFDNPDGLVGRAAGGPHIFNHQYVLARLDLEPPA